MSSNIPKQVKICALLNANGYRMESIVSGKKANHKKLLEYGFENKNGKYCYKTDFISGMFDLTVEVELPNRVVTRTIEKETGEIYTLHLTSLQGKFIGEVRNEYTQIVNDIISTCFDMDVFRFEYSKKIINYVKEKYDDEVEYLWKKFPDNAVARRKDNKKWYLAILTVKKDRFGFDNTETVEVIDIRADAAEVPNLLKRENIYAAYHMNKKRWITIILDGSVNIKEIYKFIDKSYELAKK